MTSGLGPVFEPSTVALVGASDRPGSVGSVVWNNLRSFAGTSYAVSRRSEVGGVPAFATLSGIPEHVDLAVVATPAAQVPAVAEDAVEAGVSALLVLSGGFAESGPEGIALQSQLTAIAASGSIRLVGPNCFGVQSSAVGLDASISQGLPAPGVGAGIGLVTQSGSYGMAARTLGVETGMRFVKVIALGNRADVTEADAVDYLADDPQTQVVCLVLESLREPRRLVDAARRADQKPVLAVVSGRSRDARRAAFAHTASLASDDRLVEAALRAAGIQRFGSVREMFDVALALAFQPPPCARRVAVVTNSGGTGVELVDLLVDRGAEVPELSPGLQASLAGSIPAHGSSRNPVDVTTDWQRFPDMYADATKALAESEEVDSVICVLVNRAASADVGGAVAGVVDQLRARRSPVAVHVCALAPEAARAEVNEVLRPRSIPVWPWPDRAADAVAGSVDATLRIRGRRYDRGPDADRLPATRSARVPFPAGAGDDARLLYDWLSDAGIAVVDTSFAATVDDVRAAAETLGGEVVLKAVHPGIVHKSDVAGVRVGLRDGAEVVSAAADLLGLITGARVAVQPRLRGPELAVGAVRDPVFGPVVMVGIGGVFVELVADVVFGLAPVRHDEAADLWRALSGWPALAGARGGEPVDVDALAAIASAVADLLVGEPAIEELELNPVIWSGGRCVAVDWRARVESTPEGE